MDLDFSFEITSLSFPPDFKIYVDDHLIEPSQSGEFQEKTKLYYQLIDCDKPVVFIRSILQKGDSVVIYVKSSDRKGFPKLHKDIYKTDETEYLFIILVNGGLNPLADSMGPSETIFPDSTESSFNDPLPPLDSFHINKYNNGLPTNQSNESKDDPFQNLDLGGLILHKGSSKKHNPMSNEYPPMGSGILDKLKGLFQDEDSYERYKQPPVEGNITPVKNNGENAEIEVYYATERNLKESKNSKIIKFGNNRAGISLGVCKVNIPKKKRQGEIPRPTWWKFEFKASPDKHMLILESKLLDPKTFFGALQAKVQASKEAFVFVHGFNVSFDNSVLQAAQIAHDINFQGAPIVYSWPSKANLLGYVVDGENSNYSTKNIVMFLKDVQQKTGAEKIHLIAHSMGNRALTDALMLLHQEEFHKTFLFNQIILAAPDIDAQLFLRDIAPKIINCSGRVTIYASSEDKALKVSKKLHGNLNRVGQITDQILTSKGIDTIDASKVRTDLLGHGYFSSTAPLIQDIFHLTKNNLSPQERNLKKIQTDNGLYWAFSD